jgi:hypothetical protein
MDNHKALEELIAITDQLLEKTNATSTDKTITRMVGVLIEIIKTQQYEIDYVRKSVRS